MNALVHTYKMGTGALTFASFVLILQVVSGVYSSFPEKSQIYRLNDINDLKGAALNDGIKDKQFKFQNDIKNPHNLDNLDDIYESQLPPPPTQEDISADTSVEDEVIENENQGTSHDSTHIDSNVLSGAGHLETNEIIKVPKAILKRYSYQPLPTSTSNSEDDKPKVNKDQAPVETKKYSYPELDKAVEKAMNNLPPSNESPLVPLIQAFNEKIQQQTPDEYANQGELEMKKRLQKRILLKLANRVQKLKEAKDSQVENLDINEPQVQEQKEAKSTQVESLNEPSEENQPCDCEGRCEGEMSQDQTEADQNSTPDHGELTDEEQDNSNRNPKILARLIVTIRKPKSDDADSTQGPPPIFFSPPMQEPSPFGRRDDPSLAHMFLKITKSKSSSSNAIPAFTFENNEGDNSPEERSLQKDVNPSTPISLRILRKQLIIRKHVGGYEDENSQEGSRTSFSRFLPNETDNDFNTPEIRRIQYNQPMPKEFLLLKHIHDVMKAKAAANALRENQERQVPQFFSSPFYGESSGSPSPPSPRLVIIRPRHQLTEPQLPPLHFPDENSGYKIKHLSDSRDFPAFKGLNKENSGDDSELSPPAQILKRIQKVTESQDLDQQSNYSSPQDLPWFIKNILANISRPSEEGRIQPIPTQFTPVEKPAEEKNPVLFRAFLAPYAL